MAEDNIFPINRRGFLVSAAVATVVPVPRGEAAEATPLVESFAPPAPLPLGLPLTNLCAATRERIVEIMRRNTIRREGKLPLLDVTRELRRLVNEQGTERQMKEREEFDRFASAHRGAAWEQVLRPWREREGPNWRPNSIIGMGFQNEVNRILWERFDKRNSACAQ